MKPSLHTDLNALRVHAKLLGYTARQNVSGTWYWVGPNDSFSWPVWVLERKALENAIICAQDKDG